ncbi:S8 family serine peptidase [Myxococcota bacterium]|nr:S8 family serine peptidase [Myxococcota bacterium]
MPVPKRIQVSLLGLLFIALIAVSAGIPNPDPPSPMKPLSVDSGSDFAGLPSQARPGTRSRETWPKGLGPRPAATPETLRSSFRGPDGAPSSLDRVPLRTAAETLERAIRRAQAERPFHISPDLVDRLVDQGDVQVIVSQPDPQENLEDRLAQTRHSPTQYFRYIPFAAIEVGPQALLNLIESPDVLGIEEDRTHRPSLATSVALISGDVAHNAGFDGSDQAVAILDTGIDPNHPAFAGRMLDEACFSRLGHCPNGESVQLGPGAGVPCDFDCDHGTLVAGAALALDTEGSQSGVAPDAGIISIMVYSDYQGRAASFMSDIISGLEHVYALRDFHDIAAVNLSLGGEAFSSEESCDQSNTARKAIIDLLREENIAAIVASGNDGHSDRITEPACISSAISVGATSKADSVSSFSNSASFLTLLAPGQQIRTTRIGGGFALASGTSIAAPHVAGAWAAIKEAHPERSVSEILFALQSTGEPLIDSQNTLTFPSLDVALALEALGYAEEPDASSDDTENPPNPEPSPTPQDRGGRIGLEVLVAAWVVRFRRKKRL